MNKYRKYVTSTVGFTFVVVGATGLLFQFFFKTPVLEHIHGWLGVGMVVAAILHILQNQKPMQNYLRDWRVLLLLVPIVLVITLLAAGQKGKRREPNLNSREIIGKLSQASATDLAKVFGTDVTAVLARIKADGLQAESPAMTVQELARQNHRSPEVILPYFVK